MTGFISLVSIDFKLSTAEIYLPTMNDYKTAKIYKFTYTVLFTKIA